MKALCELCGQIFVLMEFAQSLPFLLRDGGREDKKILFPNNSARKGKVSNQPQYTFFGIEKVIACHAMNENLVFELFCCVCSLFVYFTTL